MDPILHALEPQAERLARLRSCWRSSYHSRSQSKPLSPL